MGGSLVIVGNVDGATFSINPGLVILKSLKLLGSAGVSRRSLRSVLERVSSGAWAPKIERVGGYEDAALFHERLETAGAQGRLIISADHR